VSYEEEGTFACQDSTISYEEEDICVSCEEEDTCACQDSTIYL